MVRTASAQQKNAEFITTDIDNFWTAYDRIITTKDSATQYQYLNKLFLEKGTPGLKAIMEVRDYTAKTYIDAINRYPMFWNSIRANTLKAKNFAAAISTQVEKLKKLYPELKPAKVYFTIGALRTNGTTKNGIILIGCELAFGDKNTVTTEFTANLQYLKNFFINYDPINVVVFNNVHEYVHTQQKTTVCNNLLGQCVMEGVAEFMAVKATGKASVLPAMVYGNANAEKVKQKFVSQMFNPDNGFWLYSDANNVFSMRDLGYYVGYTICENYYNRAADKKLAIKQMIALDYNNQADLEQFVNRSGYLDKPVGEYENAYEASRPMVIGIKPFKNGDQNVDPSTTQITIEFSTGMGRTRGFDIGPLGVNNIMRIKKIIAYSDDRKLLTIEIEKLKPDYHYQLLVSDSFQNLDGTSLKPYLIDFKTAGQ